MTGFIFGFLVGGFFGFGMMACFIAGAEEDRRNERARREREQARRESDQARRKEGQAGYDDTARVGGD